MAVTPISQIAPKPFLGAQIPNPKVLSSKVQEIATVVNTIQQGGLTLDSVTSATSVTATTSLSVGTTASITGALNYKKQVTDTGGAYATPVVLTTAQSGRFILVDDAAGLDFTLPAIATAGIGTFFEFFVTVSVTSNLFRVTAATGDLMVGSILLVDDTAAYTAPQGIVVKPNTTFLVMSMNGTTSGGKIGSHVKFTATSATQWCVTGNANGSGVLAGIFS
jgi:hypothetical protein